MDPEIKKTLIRLYLQTLYGETFQESWLDNMERYEWIGQSIEYINTNLFSIDKLTHEDSEYKDFVRLVGQAVDFNDDIPPNIIGYDGDALEDEVELLKFKSLTNYTNRVTKSPPLSEDVALSTLKDNALKVLSNVVKTVLPNADILSTPKKLKEAIDWFEKKHEEEKNSDEKAKFKSILSLLKNIDKISKLEVIDIPNEQGKPSRFCTMAESAGGVTEKISVTPREEVTAKLQKIVENGGNFILNTQEGGNFIKGSKFPYDAFKEYTSACELKTKGILKLPKHGKTIEVQREAIALNIARILGFETTKSTMVNHNGKAALYVPFDNIQLMKEFAQGETQRVIVPSGITKIRTIGDPYLHHSTITPVGNGLHCDTTLNDFGDKAAFSFLCNDTDFVGAYNQNKAIIRGKDLYIFDQVIMSSDKMDFDTRLSMIPTGVKRHSRHNQGRNRSLIEDSSFDAKFDGVIHLLNNQERINAMMDNIIETHDSNLKSTQQEINSLNQIEPLGRKQKERLTFLTEQQGELLKLKKDAETIKGTINNRFDTMFKNFPSMNKAPMTPALFLKHKDEIKPALELEKLVNNPVLFSDDGRPYRHPWTTRNSIRITAIEESGENMRLTFSEFKRERIINILRSAGVNLDLCKKNGNTLIIPKEELKIINENSIYPERAPFIADSKKKDYLDMNSIKLMSAGYSGNNFNFAKKLIGHYQAHILLNKEKPARQVEVMYDTLHAIKGNPGFAKHLELKLQLDIQQKLRPIILKLITVEELQVGMKGKLAQAYEAAVKLDRLNDLNHVLMRFVKNPVNTNQKALIEYLDNCIKYGASATDYNTAKVESLALLKESHQAYGSMPKRAHNPMLKLGAPVLKQDWEDVDVLTLQEQQLEEQRKDVLSFSDSVVKSQESVKSLPKNNVVEIETNKMPPDDELTFKV
ncbi:coiled-coil protein [Legionella santicrucis]|uniref:Coiled-coil protein n=1 Tax=Legionella santicrucis TaxID=45074 RepID=A0A0W0YHF8_9GAMM|nr:hypothetical protein [Legionella santicrucis]KTD56348.1 coiled-coil protein [Legionella santicrucis]